TTAPAPMKAPLPTVQSRPTVAPAITWAWCQMRVPGPTTAPSPTSAVGCTPGCGAPSSPPVMAHNGTVPAASSGDSLRVLVTQFRLAERSGTELYAYELARSLIGLGHHAAIYSSRLGALADEVRAAGVPVIEDP